jgi:hypothetical protein
MEMQGAKLGFELIKGFEVGARAASPFGQPWSWRDLDELWSQIPW